MIIKCAHCAAAYEFPVKDLPADGMRVKCGSCKHVMLIRLKSKSRRPGRALRQARIRNVTTLPPPVVAQGAGADLSNRRSFSKSHETPRRAEKTSHDGRPSIIIDMGQLDSPEKPSAPPPSQVEAKTFSPLAAAPSLGSADRAGPSSFDLQGEEVEVIAIRPPRMWPLWVAIGVLNIAGFMAYVGWRNNWSPQIFDDPKLAFDIAIGVRERPKPKKRAPVVIVEAETHGTLKLQDIQLELLSTKRGRAAIISGTVHNDSNRTQKAIGIEVAVINTSDGLPIKIRVVGCCEVFDKKMARKIIRDPKHPHFSTTLNEMSKIKLAPGERRAFTAIVRGLNAGVNVKRLAAQAKIKFSEPE